MNCQPTLFDPVPANPQPQFVWDAETTDRLIKARDAGKSAGVIAREFGVTRNTICGKLNRIGLNGWYPAQPRINNLHSLPWTDEEKQTLRAEIITAGTAALAERFDRSRYAVQHMALKLGLKIPHRLSGDPALKNMAARKRARARIWNKPIEEPPPEGAVDFMGLHHGMCRYPYGEATDLETLRFCGSDKIHHGSSYCAAHYRIAYRPT